MVEWLCKRCAKKLGKSIESEPMVLCRCTGCDVENYCYPAGHAGEDAEPAKAAEIARSQAAVHGKVEGEVGESILEDLTKASDVTERTLDPEAQQKAVDKQNEVQSEDVVVSEEVVPTEDTPTDGDAITYELDPEKTEVIVTIKPEMREVVEENVTATLEEQIAALRAKIDAYEAEKE